MTLMSKRGGRRSAGGGTTLHNATTTNRAYLPHRPGYHWEPAKQPQDDNDDEDDFLQRIVHGSCQGVPGCQGEKLTCHMVEQLDLFMHCRHPAAFLSLFHDHHDRRGSVEIMHAGAYSMPEGCEYCGASDTQHCRSTNCRRPELYFQKKRPPFAKPDPARWDPVTEHPIKLPVRPASPFEGNWVAGLFLGGRTESKMNSKGR